MTLQNYKSQVLKDPRAKKLNFKPDGRKHSVYRITHIINLEHYYGSKSNNKILGEGYKSTSSDLDFMNEQKNHPQNFKYKIIKTYDNSADKMIHEAYLHQKFDVKLNESFYNKANQTPFGFDTTGISSVISEKQRKQMSERMLGTTMTEEIKNKISKSVTGFKHTDEAKKKISEASKNMSEETRLKIGSYHAGEKCHTALKIEIYDQFDNLVITTNGDFENVCERLKLPKKALKISYSSGGEGIYQKAKGGNAVKLIRQDLFKFKGWRAVKV